MSVKAKFKCVELKRMSYYDTGVTEGVILQACSGPGNEEWSKFTPSGRLEMQITNPAALEQFHLGKFYFLTFEEEESG